MNTMKDRKSLWLPMAVLAVVFLLALGGCVRGANTGNTSGNQATGQTPGSTSTTTSGGSSASDELNRLQQIDQQNQNDNNSLNTDDQNANQSQGSDQNTQPTGSLNLNGAVSVNTAVAPAAPVCTTVACVQKFGDVQIAARVVALDKLKLYAQGHKALTDTQRSTIVNDANTNESGLKDLKTKLDGETDINAAKTDVQDIYTKYRIYAVVLQRDYGEILLFHEQHIITRMTDAEPTIADLIQKDQAAGHDVSKLNTLFQDYKNKVAEIGRASC